MTDHGFQLCAGIAAPPASEPPTGESFAAVVARYEGPLLRYATRLVGPAGEQPQDIVQETFLRLHRQRRQRNAKPVANVQSWLYRVAHNLAMDERRKRRRRAGRREIGGEQLTRDPPMDTQALDALNDMVQREAAQCAIDELKRLPDELQHVLELRVMHGLTMRQIRDVTGTPLATVNHQLNRALRELSSRLKRAGVV